MTAPTKIAIGLVALSLTACAEMPEGGPTTREVKRQEGTEGYRIVRVSPQVLAALAKQDQVGMAATFSTGEPAPVQAISVGDVVSVTIWDLGSGLFSGTNPAAASATPGMSAITIAPASGAATIPNQVVDETGDITVPFAGRIPAAGKTPAQVQAEIRAALKGKANEAQALVTVSQTVGAAVTVAGDVNHPARVPLTVGGTRLLDIIAISGGTVAPASDMSVQVTRGGRARRVRLLDVINNPAENIYLRPNDVVVLDKEPQSVVVLGATNHNAQIPFGKSDFTLAEALGNGGGLTDIQADPAGVFVFRYEPEAAIRSVEGAAAPTSAATQNVLRPVIYAVNMKRADGFFEAQAFKMRDRDIVYVANHETVQLGKLLRIFGQISSVVRGNGVASF